MRRAVDVARTIKLTAVVGLTRVLLVLKLIRIKGFLKLLAWSQKGIVGRILVENAQLLSLSEQLLEEIILILVQSQVCSVRSGHQCI